MLVRVGAWAAIALLTLYLVFIGGGWQGIYSTDLRALTVTLAGLALAGWAVVAWRRPAWRPRSVLLPAILACLGSLAISTVFSRHPRLSVEYLGYAIVLAALYLLLVRILADPWFRARIATLTVSLAIVIGGLFVARVVMHWIDWWGLVGRVTAPPLRPNFESLTFGNPSAVMTLSVLMTAAAVASIGATSTGRRIAAAAVVLLSGVVTLLSGSRAGWFAIVVAGAVTIAAVLVRVEGREAARELVRRPLAKTAGRAVAGGAVVAAALAVVALGPAVVRRLLEGGEDLRGTFLAIALRLFGESPIVGVGPGVWVASRVAYTRPPEIDYYIPHAHDIWLQTPAELGLVGAVAGLILVASLVALVRDAVRDAESVRRRWGWATLAALAYFGAHQVFDFYANMPAILFAAAVPVAWLDATAGSRSAAASRLFSPRTLRGGTAAAAVLATAAAIGGLSAAEVPAARHDAAVNLANEGRWAEAAPLAFEAAAADPGVPPYEMTAALAAIRTGDPARAAPHLRAVIAVDPLPEAWLALALVESGMGDRADAIAEIREALRLGYQRPAIAMAAGDLALRLDPGVAIDAFAAAIVGAPSLAGDPYWAGVDAAVVEAAFIRALDEAPTSSRWLIALEAADLDLARARAAELDDDAALLAAEVIDAWSGDAPAMRKLVERCDAEPLNPGPLAWCARLAGRSGDVDEQNRYRVWADAIIGGSAAGGAALRVNPLPSAGRTQEGGVAIFWGHYTYRRPTPWDLIAGGLLHLTLR